MYVREIDRCNSLGNRLAHLDIILSFRNRKDEVVVGLLDGKSFETQWAFTLLLVWSALNELHEAVVVKDVTCKRDKFSASVA